MDTTTELPLFAKLHGEPYTQLPRDLYIPPDALEIFLEAFEGPLDLLLYLIRRQNLNILDIPIAAITRQYMDYLALMQELRLELAAEYLVMAAWLAEIKSRLLLPSPALVEAEEEDPRAELVRRLQEYERFQQAAQALDALPRLERDLFPAKAQLIERPLARVPPPVSLAELLDALRDVLARAEWVGRHQIQREVLSVRERMSQVLERLDALRFTPFTALFRPEEGRMGVVVTLLAVLELLREALLELVQAEPFAPIHVRRRV
ncbi:MAG: segregation/condensation protein A [Candidatus Competibacteraceae bacterium]|nr:segregation/condensation protein A [Candidatus Competibacteraceae bacterium]